MLAPKLGSSDRHVSRSQNSKLAGAIEAGKSHLSLIFKCSFDQSNLIVSSSLQWPLC